MPGQELIWARQMGGAEALSNGLAVDGAGNAYSTGFFEGTADFDPGNGIFNLTAAGAADIFIAKLDSAGNFAWARQVTTDEAGSGLDVAIDDAGNVYVAGLFSNTADFDPGPGVFNLTASAGSPGAFVLKLDSLGDLVWARRMGGADGNVSLSTGLTIDASGNPYIVGAFGGVADLDPGDGIASFTSSGSLDIFVAKLTSDGDFVWARQMGGKDEDRGADISVDSGGNIYTTGHFVGSADFDPGTGFFYLSSTGSADIFVSKLDSDGNFAWARSIGGAGADQGFGLQVDDSGAVYGIGAFESTVDFDPSSGVSLLTSLGDQDVFLAKFDTAGNFAWARAVGGSGLDQGADLALDSNGNLHAVGGFESTVDFDPGAGVFNLTSAGSRDVFVLSLGPSGNLLRAQRTGGPGEDAGIAVRTSGGYLYVAGFFEGSADFDPSADSLVLTSLGSHDAFVTKYYEASDGRQPPTISQGGVVLATLLPTVNTVSPLSIMSVFGESFSTETILYPNLTSEGKLATTLGGACLMMNGEALPIFAVTPGQINAQVSANEAFGPASFSVVANCGSAAALTSAPVSQNLTSGAETVTVEEATPAFFIFNPVASDGFIAARFNATESQAAVAVAPVGMFNDQYGPSRPAKPGDIILLFGTGWGETTAGLTAGQLASGAAGVLPAANPKITLGGIQLAAEDVFYVGVTPETAGLYQAAIRIPANAQPGNQQVVLTVYGKSTPVGPVIPIALP